MYDPGAETLGERVANDLNLSGKAEQARAEAQGNACLLYTSPSPRDRTRSRMPSSA
mgnify:CR=1 FL=1